MTPHEVKPPPGASRPCCILLVVSLLLPFIAQPARAEPPGREREIKAALLYQFTKFIRWPADDRKTARFAVCVLGADPLGKALDRFEGRKVRGRTLRIVRLKRLGKAKCQVLVVSPSEDSRLEEVLRTLGKSATLTVGESKRFARRGGMIEFRKEKKRISLVCNNGAAKRARLKISARLLGLMKLVRP